MIDRAISESRAALAEEPASALAQESLLDALDTKVVLLQDTVALASDRGDVSDDAAGAAKELNQSISAPRVFVVGRRARRHRVSRDGAERESPSGSRRRRTSTRTAPSI